MNRDNCVLPALSPIALMGRKIAISNGINTSQEPTMRTGKEMLKVGKIAI